MWSINQHPLIPLIFCIVAIIIVILQCFTKHRFLKVRFIIAFILAFSTAMILVFYQMVLDKAEAAELAGKAYYIDDIINWTLVGIDVCVGGLLISTIEFSLSGERFQRELTALLDETKFYVVLDKKDRIKEISKAMASDIGVEESELIGKNVFDAIELKYMLIGVNREDFHKNEIKKYYKNYEKYAVEGVTKSLEFNLQDDNGIESAYFFKETVIFNNHKYKGRIFLGDKRREEDLVGIESELYKKKGELDIIKLRFGVLLNKANDGIYFNNLTNKTIWFNDVLVEKLGLNSNNVSSSDFFRNIHPDDVSLYQERIKNLSEEYELSYRYNTGMGFVYVKETGSRITSDNQVELCGIMNVIDDASYEKTGTILDRIKNEEALKNVFEEVINSNIPFQVVYFKLNSIPDINQKCGRAIGNTMMAKYLTVFKENFIVDNLIFRVNGLEFVGIITSLNKMELLKNNLNKNSDSLLHGKARLGNQSVSIDVTMGISNKEDSQNGRNAIKLAKEACKIASNPQFRSDFAYYRDVK